MTWAGRHADGDQELELFTEINPPLRKKRKSHLACSYAIIPTYIENSVITVINKFEIFWKWHCVDSRKSPC